MRNEAIQPVIIAIVAATAISCTGSPQRQEPVRLPTFEEIYRSTDAAALTAWGRRYERGVDVVQDTRKALLLYCRAADKGDVDAKFYLGQILAFGRDIEHDEELAAAWLQAAAEQGDRRARNMLLVLNRDDKPAQQATCPVGQDSNHVPRKEQDQNYQMPMVAQKQGPLEQLYDVQLKRKKEENARKASQEAAAAKFIANLRSNGASFRCKNDSDRERYLTFYKGIVMNKQGRKEDLYKYDEEGFLRKWEAVSYVAEIFAQLGQPAPKGPLGAGKMVELSEFNTRTHIYLTAFLMPVPEIPESYGNATLTKYTCVPIR